MNLLSAPAPATADAPAAFHDALAGYRQSMAGLHTRGTRRLESAINALKSAPGPHHARALLLSGLAARASCSWAAAETKLTEATDRLRSAQEPAWAALALALRVDAVATTGRLDDARAAIEEIGASPDGRALTDLANAVYKLARGDLQEALQLAAPLSREAGPLQDLAEVLSAEARIDLKRPLEAEAPLAALLERIEKARAFDETYVRALAVSARLAVDLVAQQSGDAVAHAVARARAAVRKGLTYAVSFGRYRASLLVSAASLAAAEGREPGPRLEEAMALFETTQSRLDQACELARHGAFRVALAQGPARLAIGRARDTLSRAGADARVKLLSAAESGGEIGASMMLGKSTFAGSMLGVALGEGGDDLELQAVFQVNEAIASVLDLDELLQKILDEVVKALKAERGALLRREPDGTVRCVAARRIDPTRVKEGSDEVSFSAVRAAEQSGRVVLSDNAQLDERFRGQASVLATEIRSLLCAPLKTQKALHGFLYLDSTLKSRIFKESHRELLSVFATQAAVAIENALAFSEIDALNRGLEKRVEERTSELARANAELARSLKELETTRLALLEAQKEALEKEMQVARSIQESIVPPRTLIERRGLRLFGRVDPATQVGGDFWTYLPLPDDATLLLVGDVTGHGVGSGMVTTLARAVGDTLLRRLGTVDAQDLLSTLSDVIYASAQGRMMMTAFACVVTPSTRTLTFANAGHNAPYVVEAAGGLPKVGALVSRGPRLGDAAGNTFTAKTKAYQPGDRVLLFTDGLVECTNASNEQYGERRLRRSVLAHAREPLTPHLERVVQEAEEFFGTTPRVDDVTAVMVELL